MCSWVLQTVCCAKKGCFSNRLNQGKCTKDEKVSGFGLIWKKNQHSTASQVEAMVVLAVVLFPSWRFHPSTSKV
jgi:hypothetical protein